MTFGLNPNSTETEAEFQGTAIAQNKSSGGTSKAVKIGVSIGVILFALIVSACIAAFIVHHRWKRNASPAYDGPPEGHYAGDNKTEDKPPVPLKKHELYTPVGQELDSPAPQYELPDRAPVELAGSRVNPH
jgi:hypothetical protein